MNLEDNIFALNHRLSSGLWKHDQFEAFSVHDPKLRRIHKASVRDRVLYQAVYRILYQVFDPGFIFQSFSSRKFKGTHRGVRVFERQIRQLSKNHTHIGHALKCDIRKFFDSIDHVILFELIRKKVCDPRLLQLIKQIVSSFAVIPGKGLPLGNVTSQLFANIYMNELDQFIKRGLKAKYYVRYCDDFVILSDSRGYLVSCLEEISRFCKTRLLLSIHPNKIVIRKLHQGIDFLGYVSLPHRRALRTRTKRRMFRKVKLLKAAIVNGGIKQGDLDAVKQSYLGVLSHCKGEKIGRQIKEIIEPIKKSETPPEGGESRGPEATVNAL